MHVARHMHIVCDVVVVKFKIRTGEQMLDIFDVPGQEVIHSDNVVPLRQHAIAEVGSDESGSAGNEDSLFQFVLVLIVEIIKSEVFARRQKQLI